MNNNLLTSFLKTSRLMFGMALLPLNPALMKKVGECKQVENKNAGLIYVIKQWHLPPSVNTKLSAQGESQAKGSALPQSKNQTEIYDQLVEWIEAKKLDTVVAEGCELKSGQTIDEKFSDAFQGWSFSDLTARASDRSFRTILAHPVVKLKVHEANHVNALCGDELSEIKKSQLALSDARADVGYLSRISENQNNQAKLKSYLDGVIEIYHLKPGASVSEAKTALTLDLKKSLKLFEDSTHERNLSFIRKLTHSGSHLPAALVVGGLHAGDLKSALQEKQQNCVILEPHSYQNDEEALNLKLNSLLNPVGL